jgi:hypothetical protein
VLQRTFRSTEKLVAAMVCPDGRPALTWRGGIRVVDVRALRNHLGPDSLNAEFGPAEALELIVNFGAVVPKAPGRNARPLPLGALRNRIPEVPLGGQIDPSIPILKTQDQNLGFQH